MKTVRGWILPMLITPIALTMTSCGGSSAGNGKKHAEQENASAVPVRIEELRPQSFVETIQVLGIVKANDDIILSAEEGGVVAEWKYRKGDYVPKDSAIVILRDDVIVASYESAKAQYAMAQMNYEKQASVFKEQGVSELQLRNAEYTRDAAKAQAELARARWEKTRLRSPVGGFLEERFVDAAELASPGMPVARVVNVRYVKIVLTIPERYATSVSTGAHIVFMIPAVGPREFSGKISFVGSTVSPDNRSLSAEAIVENRERILKPEMVARVTIAQSQPRSALVVPEELVQRLDQDKLVVYVVADGVAEERIVSLGGRERKNIEVIAGLKPGDRLVVSGFNNLIDGQTVTVLK